MQIGALAVFVTGVVGVSLKRITWWKAALMIIFALAIGATSVKTSLCQ